jgi:hypothetical protein
MTSPPGARHIEAARVLLHAGADARAATGWLPCWRETPATGAS